MMLPCHVVATRTRHAAVLMLAPRAAACRLCCRCHNDISAATIATSYAAYARAPLRHCLRCCRATPACATCQDIAAPLDIRMETEEEYGCKRVAFRACHALQARTGAAATHAAYSALSMIEHHERRRACATKTCVQALPRRCFAARREEKTRVAVAVAAARLFHVCARRRRHLLLAQRMRSARRSSVDSARLRYHDGAQAHKDGV